MSRTVTIRVSHLVVAATAVLLLVVLAWRLDAQSGSARAQAARHARWSYSLTPASVQSWMTFNYLDAVFKLPSGYLEGALGIDDARYPDISIRQYARLRGIDPALFLTRVQGALESRTATSTP